MIRAFDIVQQVVKLPKTLYERNLHSFSFGIRIDIPPLLKEFSIYCAFPRFDNYEISSIEFSTTGYKDGDKFHVYLNDAIILQDIYTKELPQRIELFPLIRFNSEVDNLIINFVNATATSKTIWFDLNCSSENIVNELNTLPSLKVIPETCQLIYGDALKYTVLCLDSSGCYYEDVTEDCIITPPQQINLSSNNIITKTSTYGMYTINFNYKDKMSTATVNILPKLKILTNYSKIGVGHNISLEIYTYDKDIKDYVLNKADSLEIDSPAYISTDGIINGLTVPKIYKVIATYCGERAEALVEVVPLLYISPLISELYEGESLQCTAFVFNKGTQQYEDITWLTEWGVDYPLSITSEGLLKTDNVDFGGKDYKVIAVYGKLGKYIFNNSVTILKREPKFLS